MVVHTYEYNAARPSVPANIGPRSGPKSGGRPAQYGSGKATLRLRANGPAVVEQAVSERDGRGWGRLRMARRSDRITGCRGRRGGRLVVRGGKGLARGVS